MTGDSIIYTVRYLKGGAWETHLDAMHIACGHEDITPDELANDVSGHFTSQDAAAQAIVEALVCDAEIEQVCVWRQYPLPGDATGPVMALARDMWFADAERRMKAGKMDADHVSDAAPRPLLAHGLDDLIADMLAEVEEETRAEASARAWYRWAAQ